MTDTIQTDALTSLVVALISSPLIVFSGAKGLDGLRWLAKKFLDLTET